jgi:hypothetical protein
MPTPSKPVLILEMEKRSHRTKKELAQRRKSEAALISGEGLKEREETKANRIAHKEFQRMKKLLTVIGKADGLYTGVINRYCLLYAECCECVKQREDFTADVERLRKEYESGKSGLVAKVYYPIVTDIQKSVNVLDKLAMDKRKMLLSIEKECVMTIAAALRAVPKKPADEDEDDPMAGLLSRRVK